jgi:hypothetical protein
MTFPIVSEPGRQKFSEKGSLKTLNVTKLKAGKEVRKYVIKETP